MLVAYIVFWRILWTRWTFVNERFFCMTRRWYLFRIFVSCSIVMNYCVGICFFVLSFFLVGCWSDATDWGNNEEKKVTADWFHFTIPAWYESVIPALIENKQLVNKILLSYKLPSDEKWIFEQNVIFTRSSLPPDINFEQFWTLNAQKMSSELAWYTPWKKLVRLIPCEDREIQWLYVTFSLSDPRQTPPQKVWLAQLQFVDRYRGYILSAAYRTESEQDWFEDLLDSFWCEVWGTWTWTSLETT